MLLLCLSCNRFPDKTKKLNNLLSEYSSSISKNPHLYIIRSDIYCEGCVQLFFLQLKDRINANKNLPITLISSDMDNMIKLSNILFIQDTQNIVMNEFSSFPNLSIIETKNGIVINYKNLNDTKDISLPDFAIDFINNY